MSKQCLDVQQMLHLQELGLDTRNASMCWIKDTEGNRHLSVNDEYCYEASFMSPVPAYTLQDVLDKLPTEILLHKTRCWLSIDFVEGLVEYYSEGYNEVREHMRVEQFHKDKPLIDAAYAMLSWCIYNKFVEPNKNE